MIFSVQRFLEDYFSHRGWSDPDHYAVKLANAYWSDASSARRLERIRRIRTAFYAANRALERRRLEDDLFNTLERRFKKKLGTPDPLLQKVVAALPAQRRLLAGRGERITIEAILSRFASLVEALAIDAFWKSRSAGRLQHRPEKIGQTLLAAFAKGVLGDRGHVIRELFTGVGFADVALIRSVMHLIELKVERTSFSGVEQLDSYMATHGRLQGWLLVFDASRPGRKLTLPHDVTTATGRIRVIRVNINPAIPSRRKRLIAA